MPTQQNIAHRHQKRRKTVSIALPSSILLNAQSPELRIYLAGQVARAAAIYNIDEIIIFDEVAPDTPAGRFQSRRRDVLSDPTSFFLHVLDYLETPQYLRRHLFPMSQELKLVGLLNPLALPSHLSRHEYSRWREGVAISRTNVNVQYRSESDPPPTRYVDVGQERLVEVERNVPSGQRVTVDMSPSGPEYDSCPGKYLFGKLAEREAPVLDGIYWGYRVRRALCLSDVFSNSAVSKGYDVTIGTSERGTPVTGSATDVPFSIPQYEHLLIVFGGVHGLERSTIGDARLENLGISYSESGTSNHDVGDLFDFYINTCPNQGSRTIRTEEALLITLASLHPHLITTHSSKDIESP